MSTSLERLDQRQTGYRFDLEQDVPWARLHEPGVFFTDAMLHRLGFDAAAIARTSGARAALDVLLALCTARNFAHLETDVIAFVAEQGGHRPSRSADMLVEEERKHVALFTRLFAELEARRPLEARALGAVHEMPPSFEHLKARSAHYASADELAWTFWLNTLFFEEYTVFFQHALEEVPPETVQPVWLAAHRCHRQEELQHVLTDMAYLEGFGLDADTQRRLSKSFVFFLDEGFAQFFGVRAASRALASLFPFVAGLPTATARFRDVPLFQDVLRHRAFRQTRRAAPYLGELRLLSSSLSLLDGGPPAFSPGVEDVLTDRLERAAHQGGRGVVFVQHDGSDEHVPYAALWREAEARLAVLQERGARAGDFVVLLTAQPRQTVPWFWACVLGGLVPAPLALPTTAEDAEELGRLLRIHAQLNSPWLVADEAVAPLVRELLAAVPGAPERVVSADSSSTQAAVLHRARADDTALVQFSSGSMGDPRGVLLTHRNLLSDITAMLAFRQHGDDEVFVSWMPLFHDMGLIGYHLTPLVAGVEQVLLSPFVFMRDPVSWLDAITRHKASITGGPNFALARLLPRLTPDVVARLDLSSLHTFLVGAEPIAKPLLDAFGVALSPAGLRADALCPAYGLAEATLAVTMLPPGEVPSAICVRRDSLEGGAVVVECAQNDPASIELVNVGGPLPGVQLRIVDEHARVLPEGAVGAIELMGPTVTPGYHGEAPLEGWFDTGDLGLVRGGRLFVTGRKKDVFFVGGRNHYAHDVENVARELPFLHPGAVALVVDWNQRWGVDDLLLFVALRPEVLDVDAALAQVHGHVQRRLGISLGRVVQIQKGDITRTTSGKIKRRGLLEQMRAGAFTQARSFAPPRAPVPHHTPKDATDVLGLVRAVWAEVLELPLANVGFDDEFRALGGDSFKAVQIHDRLEKKLALTLSPDVLVVGTTPRRMAEFLQAPLRTQTSAVQVVERVTVTGTTTPARADDIAVVALAVRAPQVETPDQLWQLLREQRHSIGVAPAARALDARVPGDAGLLHGSWFDRVDAFDAALFSLSDAEARAMGPAQRLFLEVGFEALSGAVHAGRRVGVFVGAGNDGYAQRYLDEPQLVTGHSLLGALPNMVAARVARTFGLTGPALTVDTACSSSLTAVHLACESLRAGDCDMALVGGVQVGLSGDLLLSFQRAGLLSKDGHSRPFDDAASGLVPGEAAGAVVLKPLQRALQDGDHIHAVICGSATNNDGGALSGTAPSPHGQADVITRAWRNAALDPTSARFIEAHAAGTAVGDAVEVRALQTAIPATTPVALGSIKGNLGHTLAAAGIMSLLKAVLALEHSQFPATCGLLNPAARADFGRGALVAAQTPVGWNPDADPVASAGVSSFGLGGTNVHVVLQAAPTSAPHTPNGPHVFCVASQPGAEHQRAQELLQTASTSTHSVAHLAAASRGMAELLPQRSGVVVDDAASLVSALSGLAAAPTPSPRRGKIAFIFPGPGSQVPGMGRALAEAEPVFRDALLRCAAVLRPLGVELLPLLFADDVGAAAPIHRLSQSQPAVFSYGYALACWWQELGVRPDFVMGHSAGEYVAAHVAGMLSLQDALTLVTERGRAMASAAPGRMAAVMASRVEVQRLLSEGEVLRTVAVAAINAPQQTVISGAQHAIDAALAACSAQGIAARALDVDCAAHTPALRTAAAAFLERASSTAFSPGRIPLVSSLTGELLPQLSAAHLARHVLEPVDFVAAVRTLRALGADLFLEQGATAGLSACVRQIVDADGDDVTVVASGARDGQDLRAPLQAAVEMLNAGVPLHPSRLGARGAATPVEVLGAPYRRRRLWIERGPRAAGASGASTTPPASIAPRHVLSWDSEAAIRDHVTAGQATAPASLLMDLLLDDASAELGAVELADCVVLRPLALSPGEVRTVEVGVDAARGDGRVLRSFNDAVQEPQVHLSARVVRARGRVTARLDVAAIRARTPRTVGGDAVYARLQRTGFVMGPSMRAVQSVQVGDGELLAQLQLPDGGSRGRRVDPALLDGASHAMAALFLQFPQDGGAPQGDGLYLGFSIERVRVHHKVHQRCLAYVRVRSTLGANMPALRYDITLLKEDGEVLAELEDFSAKRVTPVVPTPASVGPLAAPMVAGAGRAALVTLVQGLVAARLRRAPAQVAEHAPLVRLGVDSLMAVELVKQLEQRLGIKLYATLLFEATTVGEVADRLLVLQRASGTTHG